MNEIDVVHALAAGSGSVTTADAVAGSLGLVGGQEVMKPDAIVKSWPRLTSLRFSKESEPNRL